jgi:tetratricopeptide (TPR) repeat protein
MWSSPRVGAEQTIEPIIGAASLATIATRKTMPAAGRCPTSSHAVLFSTMRPRQHVLEEESKRALRAALPAEWVVREQDPDYGIDFRVDVFRQGNPTRFAFACQLKGTDALGQDDTGLSYRFKTERLRQYINQGVPVMLAVFDAPRNQLYYEWAWTLYTRASTEDRRNWVVQQSVSLVFDRQLTQVDRADLEREIRHITYFLNGHRAGDPPLDVSVRSSVDPTSGERIADELAAWVATTGSDILRVSAGPPLPSTDGEIVFGPEHLSLHCASLTAVIPRAIQTRLLVDNEVFAAKIGLAWTVSAAGLLGASIDLLTRIVSESREMPPMLGWLLANPSVPAAFARAGKTADALLLAEDRLQLGDADTAIRLATAVLFSQGSLFAHRFVAILRRSLESVPDRPRRGAIAYTLANFLRANEATADALRLYRSAKRDQPAYEDRSYWWAEVAGCLFAGGKFRSSELAYRRALALGETRIPVRALLADALLYQGRSGEAKVEFEVYLRENGTPETWAIMKYALAAELSESFGERFTRRPSVSTKNIEDAIATTSNEVALFATALREDPLSGLAWFNYATCRIRTGLEPTHKEWQNVVALQSWDLEAWANLISIYIRNSSDVDPILFAATLVHGFREHGLRLVAELGKRASGEDKVRSREALERLRAGAEAMQVYFAPEPRVVIREYLA